MKTDRELLELAAKAAGITGSWEQRLTGSGIAEQEKCQPVWNPLTDDSDAFRLAVTLHIEIEFSRYGDNVYAGKSGKVPYKIETTDQIDIFSATRRAIVLAAASIGETL